MKNGINEESLKLFIENIKKERTKEEKIEKFILNNDKYINCLIKYLREYSYLSSSNKSRKGYIKLLQYFYKTVDRYAKNNNISPIMFKNYNIYYINYNGYIFAIFRENIDGNMNFGCYSNYLNKEQIPYFIDFNDIKNNHQLSINDIFNGLIKKLVDDINELYNEGVSLYFINNIVESACIDLKNKNEILSKNKTI